MARIGLESPLIAEVRIPNSFGRPISIVLDSAENVERLERSKQLGYEYELVEAGTQWQESG